MWWDKESGDAKAARKDKWADDDAEYFREEVGHGQMACLSASCFCHLQRSWLLSAPAVFNIQLPEASRFSCVVIISEGWRGAG